MGCQKERKTEWDAELDAKSVLFSFRDHFGSHFGSQNRQNSEVNFQHGFYAFCGPAARLRKTSKFPGAKASYSNLETDRCKYCSGCLGFGWALKSASWPQIHLGSLETVQPSSLEALGGLKLCKCRPWEHCDPPGPNFAPFDTLLDPFVSHLATFSSLRSTLGCLKLCYGRQIPYPGRCWPLWVPSSAPLRPSEAPL